VQVIPQPTPTTDNPERWDCDCGGLWRILTLGQIGQKFAHLKQALREGEQARPPGWSLSRIGRLGNLMGA
jgi:hypothetical protein